VERYSVAPGHSDAGRTKGDGDGHDGGDVQRVVAIVTSHEVLNGEGLCTVVIRAVAIDASSLRTTRTTLTEPMAKLYTILPMTRSREPP
jgi:hypothetical protein